MQRIVPDLALDVSRYPKGLQQLRELFRREIGLAKDRSERARGQVAVAVNGDGDESAAVGMTQVVVAAAHVGLLVAGPA
jgi:hypothetical protein